MSNRMVYTVADVPETGKYHVHSPTLGRDDLASFTETLSAKPKVILVGDAFIG